MSIEQQLKRIIQAATAQRASDVYWLPVSSGYQVLLQAAGQLRPLMRVKADVAQQLINHVKYQSNMAISDHRRPQLGAMTLTVDQQPLNLRISTVGDFMDRESLVVRILYEMADATFQYLIPDQRDQLVALMHRSGLILFSGPMGSGKTSTMYDLVQELRATKMVMTIEDPVEIYEPAFLQLQVNPTAKMAYPELLKVGLRHHPDVFIIGEIRDGETAQIAIQAALSGHLVLSTIHARGVYGIAARLAQLGVAPAALRQALTAATYQRLVPLTDGSLATLFDIVTETSQLVEAAGRRTTTTWGQLIDEQCTLGRLDLETANQLKEA
ncbi:competence type IV pilus ATPase ComGA [Lactiplantibacillus xiangfangensis]|uniref:Comg operon protein 1 n=1 Tax=Lactiplantibacillus xiangfangensis TaxID=942150 RepID=A0A0R2M1S4_9LACO|nr:competence type IV pilus ATPase ComGA [Lactiplantibacillus xiangfangensis]KRO07414.1 comg operon protein 1 [Lactiplantibacillus xiangfangensis]